MSLEANLGIHNNIVEVASPLQVVREEERAGPELRVDLETEQLYMKYYVD